MATPDRTTIELLRTAIFAGVIASLLLSGPLLTSPRTTECDAVETESEESAESESVELSHQRRWTSQRALIPRRLSRVATVSTQRSNARRTHVGHRLADGSRAPLRI